MPYTVELDISHESPHFNVLAYALHMGCTARLVREHGPAGGNPVYEFRSETLAKLNALIDSIYGIK